MDFVFETFKLTGSGVKGAAGWTQIFEFSSEESDVESTGGRLVGVITLRGVAGGVESMAAVREVVGKLGDGYYSDSGGDWGGKLASVIERLTGEYGVEIVAAALEGRRISVVSASGEAILVRAGRVFRLSGAGAGVSLVRGDVGVGDGVYLMSKELSELVTESELLGCVQGDSASGFEEVFGAKLGQEVKHAGLMGVVLLKNFGGRSDGVGKLENISGIGKSQKGNIKSVRQLFADKIGVVENSLEAKVPRKGIDVEVNEEIERGVSGRKRVVSLVGVLLLLLLVVSIYFGVRKKAEMDTKMRYESRLERANQLLSEASGLSDINYERARELFLEAKEISDELVEEGFTAPEVLGLGDEVVSRESDVLSVYRAEPVVYVDLGLQREGFAGEQMVTSGDEMVVWDKSIGRVARVGAVAKETEVVAAGDIVKNGRGLAFYSGKVFLGSENRVYELDGEGGREVLAELGVRGDYLMSVYSGNLYVVDKTDGNIWRYPGIGGGFGVQQEWFGPGVTSEFSDAQQVVVDGSIWVLVDGSVEKYSLGTRQPFSLRGVFPGIGRVDAIFTSENAGSVYLLDKAEGRIVVVSKEGVYKAQYYSEILGEAAGLSAHEKEGKLLFLVDDKLYLIVMEHGDED